jgi:glyoxylase-like metal-dependent hydrolase (beta-lactamase superfamily II)
VEITPRVHSIPATPSFYTGPQAPNVFLVADSGEGALIDSGFGDETSVKERVEFLRERPDVKVRRIVLTHHHFDHSSGASQLRDETGAEVALHSQDVEFLRNWQAEVPQDIEVLKEQKELAERVEAFRKQGAEAGPDVQVADGDTIVVGGLTLEVVHTPGHTLGSMCLYLREERALFTGDTALGLGTVAEGVRLRGDAAGSRPGGARCAAQAAGADRPPAGARGAGAAAAGGWEDDAEGDAVGDLHGARQEDRADGAAADRGAFGEARGGREGAARGGGVGDCVM